MSKRQGRILTGAILSVFVLLAAGFIAFLTLWLRAGRETGRQAAELETVQTELETLQAQYEELQAQLDEAEQARAAAEAALEQAREDFAAAEQPEQQPEEEPETQETAEAPGEPVLTLDVGALEAGTVVDAAEVDLANLEQYFQSYPIEVGDAVYNRIYGCSYVDNPNIGLSDLRYFKVLHYNFDHDVQVGELIANAALEQDYLEIFRELFENEYEIYSMHLIDNYWTGDGDSSDTASIEVNNTSAFCYRTVTGGSSLSNHAYGRAIDINPQQNPYVSYSSGYAKWYHSNADDYIDRTTGYDHVITHEDLCYQIFTNHGFSWGGDWTNPKDYQHFEKEG